MIQSLLQQVCACSSKGRFRQVREMSLESGLFGLRQRCCFDFGRNQVADRVGMELDSYNAENGGKPAVACEKV